MTAHDQQLRIAIDHHVAGRFQQALRIYLEILEADPNHSDCLHLVGLVCQAFGKFDEAVDYILRAIAINDQEARFHYNLGIVRNQLQQPDQAVECFRRAIAIEPTFGAWNNLANTLKSQGKVSDALRCLEQAELSFSAEPVLWNNRGAMLRELGGYADAEQAFRRAISLKPDYAAALANLGLTLHDTGQLDQAEAVLVQATELEPTNAGAQNNLGLVYRSQKRLSDALSALQLATELAPDLSDAHANLGDVMLKMGRRTEAIVEIRRAVQLQPDAPLIHSNLLYALSSSPDTTMQEIFREHQRWGEHFGKVTPLPARAAIDSRTDRQLRIGYVSPDLRNHAVSRFLLPVFEHHDRSKFHVTCYAQVSAPDQVTGRYRELADRWRFTCGLSDMKLARQIQDDNIDILIDLAGHTADNRLPVFAYRPAPVQVSCFGYPGTTGLRQMDWYITDGVAVAPEEAEFFTEQIYRLPRACCFQPDETAPEVGPLPADTSEAVTFVSLHRLDKLTPAVFDLWAEVLTAVAGSRLLMYRDTLDATMQTQIRNEFVRRGISAECLDLRDHVAGNYLNVYNEADISLDVFPWGAGTTAYECHWMGVPMPAIYGQRLSCRAPAVVHDAMGLPELTLHTREEYLATIVRLSADLAQLRQLRQSLRDRMRTGLTNTVGYTRSFENGLREIWSRWCDTHSGH